MEKKQKQSEETRKKSARDQRKPYIAPKLKVHGGLGEITAGSGTKSMTSCYSFKF
jgi:hypothetical protein